MHVVAGNAMIGENGTGGPVSNGVGQSPSRSPGRSGSGSRGKPRLSQPARSARARYPGAVVEAESGESVARERTRRRSHGRYCP